MGSDDLFKKRKKDRQRRRYEYRMPKANSFLIVTEGEKTEPLYFQGIQKQILKKIGGTVDVFPVIIDIKGKGCATKKLVETAERIVKKAHIIYQNIWIVFDKDDFDDFDEAVEEAVSKGYRVAWSNPSFEYWLYLHFHYSDAALHRDIWCEKLNDEFSSYKLGDSCYRKNYENIYEMLNSINGVNFAVKNAKRRMREFRVDIDQPSKYDPGTTVYELVEELREYLE